MSDQSTGEWEFQPWTAEGAAGLRAAAEAVVAAIRAHAEAVIGAAGEQDALEVFEADDVLRPVLLQYADAQFEFTGTDSPFGELDADNDDGAEDAELDDDGEPIVDLPVSGITVLQRRDYAVVDEAAILAVGRAAYRASWPDDGEAAAEADVTTLGRALYQAAHAGEGFADLDEMPGLVPTAGAVVVLNQPEPLTGDAEHWPEPLFDVDGEPLYEMKDLYL